MWQSEECKCILTLEFRIIHPVYVLYIDKVGLPDDSETTIQISTPKGMKRRRISFNTGSKMERFSLIPKLDRSFSQCESDEDFEVHVCVINSSNKMYHRKGSHVLVLVNENEIIIITNYVVL